MVRGNQTKQIRQVAMPLRIQSSSTWENKYAEGEGGIASISFVKRAVTDVYILYKVVNRLCKAVLRIILSL